MRWRLLSIALACLWAGQVTAQDVEAYAEEFPPLNFLRGGEPAGIATDLLKRACAEAGLTCQIHIVPWARAYHIALTRKNSLAFATMRTPERDGAFLWVGPILPRISWLYTLSSTPFSADLLSGKDGFVIGTVYNDVSIDDLRRIGVPDQAMENSPSIDDAVRKLMGGRVAAVVDTEIGMKWFLKTHGYDESRVKAVMPLTEHGDYYYAFNAGSDPVLVAKLHDGLAAVLAAHALPEILNAYLAPGAGTAATQ
jgi:polar amino acid transport system substrate-binding protein